VLADAQPAGERHRLLLEARRAGKPRRERVVRATAPVRLFARLLLRRSAA
jgi:hypothetical protein